MMKNQRTISEIELKLFKFVKYCLYVWVLRRQISFGPEAEKVLEPAGTLLYKQYCLLKEVAFLNTAVIRVSETPLKVCLPQ